MKANRFRLPLALSFLSVLMAGCASHRLVLEFNGRTIEVEEMRQASFARGLEVTSFDGHIMKVNGREAVTVNGKELTVNGQNVTHGNSRHVLGAQHKLVIEQDGMLRIVDQKEEAKKSWWAFWR